MRVVHICRYDWGNGAANAAYRLHTGLLGLGHDSTMFVAQKRREIAHHATEVFSPTTDLLGRIRRRLRNEQITRGLARYRKSRPSGYEAFSDDRVPYGAEVLAQLPPGDVINIHSMYHFIDFGAFFRAVPRYIPVVRTLHDMSFFTGGCHLDAGCGKYTERCGACPQLGSQETEDLSRQILQRKYSGLNSVASSRLHIVTPSRWLAEQAKRSALLQNFPVVVIPHGLDTEVFRPRNRGFAREILGVPPNALVVLFVAEPINRSIKGFTLLAQALNGLPHIDNLLLISVGGGKVAFELKIPHVHLGQIRNERLLSMVYSAADIFVIPSKQENFPLTVLEATACGTPVVGFAVGGVAEIVRPDKTGLLVPPQDVTALRAAILELLEDPVRRAEMAAQCRRTGVEEYTLELQVQRYVELYQMILEGC